MEKELFEVQTRPYPPVCNHCGQAAWVSVVSEDGERAFDYCQACEKQTTLRNMTEDEIKELKNRTLINYEMAVAYVKNKLGIS